MPGPRRCEVRPDGERTVVGRRGVREAAKIEECVTSANPCLRKIGLQLQCMVGGGQSFVAPAQLDQGIAAAERSRAPKNPTHLVARRAPQWSTMHSSRASGLELLPYGLHFAADN